MRGLAVLANAVAWLSLRPRFVYEDHRWWLRIGQPRSARSPK